MFWIILSFILILPSQSFAQTYDRGCMVDCMNQGRQEGDCEGICQNYHMSQPPPSYANNNCMPNCMTQIGSTYDSCRQQCGQ